MKTFSLKATDINRKWYLLDAKQTTLGRLSTQISKFLIGKDKPSFTPHIDNGDNVIVINASELNVTGNKRQAKTYYRHSGYPGGLYERKLDEQLQLDPTKIIFKSVRGMLPDNKLREQRLKRLHIYADNEHKHSAQKPTTISLIKKGDK